jgi:HK97 family phage major capsid protein
MAHIRDKKRWWAANFCTTHVKCAENSFLGFGLGLGLVGILIMGLMLAALASTHAPVLIGFGGILKSVELKEKANGIYDNRVKVLLKKIDAEKRDPTDQEMADLNAMNTEVDKIMATAKNWERIENHEAGRTQPPAAPDPAIDDTDNPDRSKLVKVFHTWGHQLQAIYAATTGKLVGGIASREEAYNKLHAAATGSGEAIDSDGGYLVQRDLSTEIEDQMSAEGTLLALMSPVEVSGNGLVERYVNETSRATGSRGGAVQGYWVGEADALTASKVKWEKRTTDLGKAGALGYVTDELIQDAPALSSLYPKEFGEELTFMIEDGIINGDGLAEKPLGIIGHSGTVSVTKATNQAAATFLQQNISDMWVRLLSGSKARAVWLINGELGPQLDLLSVPAGAAALEPRFVNYGPDGILRIKGRPVIEVEYCAALGTVGDIILTDLSQYRLIRKGGVTQAMSIHVRFVNDEQTFRATTRVGGQPKWKSAITPYKGTLTRAAHVTLATRS